MQKHNRFSLALLTGLILQAAFTCTTAYADDTATVDNAITPYRPSVSNSAQLPLEGQLELEMGIASARTDAARNQSLPYLFKLAFSKEWGVLLGGSARVINDDGAGQRDQGFGDTSLIIKRAFIISDETALGLEFGNKFPTAGQPLGSGKSDWTINGIVSQDLGQIHVDVNLNATHLGAADAGTSHWQNGLSSAFSTALADKWNMTAEWAGWRQAGTKNQGQVLVALTYSPNKRMTLDAGMIKGLTSASPDRTLFAGIVIPVAKLW
ncbi:transporter [Undibacterium sp. CY18W]|uniref:Transporter n=1 Tax=Undibacterium hunanense TaxID=2762292 RepID=A0ABR6ZX62_9BURK|nr:transporter [Undibacterium hunanense]MBC3920443.1 transporter [Undibacterium hunanense]